MAGGDSRDQSSLASPRDSSSISVTARPDDDALLGIANIIGRAMSSLTGSPSLSYRTLNASFESSEKFTPLQSPRDAHTSTTTAGHTDGTEVAQESPSKQHGGHTEAAHMSMFVSQSPVARQVLGSPDVLEALLLLDYEAGAERIFLMLRRRQCRNLLARCTHAWHAYVGQGYKAWEDKEARRSCAVTGAPALDAGGKGSDAVSPDGRKIVSAAAYFSHDPSLSPRDVKITTRHFPPTITLHVPPPNISPGSSPCLPVSVQTTRKDDALFPLLQPSYGQEGSAQAVAAATSSLGSSPRGYSRPIFGQTTSKENKSVPPAAPTTYLRIPLPRPAAAVPAAAAVAAAAAAAPARPAGQHLSSSPQRSVVGTASERSERTREEDAAAAAAAGAQAADKSGKQARPGSLEREGKVGVEKNEEEVGRSGQLERSPDREVMRAQILEKSENVCGGVYYKLLEDSEISQADPKQIIAQIIAKSRELDSEQTLALAAQVEKEETLKSEGGDIAQPSDFETILRGRAEEERGGEDEKGQRKGKKRREVVQHNAVEKNEKIETIQPPRIPSLKGSNSKEELQLAEGLERVQLAGGERSIALALN